MLRVWRRWREGRLGRRLRPHVRNALYLLRHKWFVFRAGLALRVPLRRLVVHDLSKLSRAEWGPYAHFFYGDHPTEADRAAAKAAFKKAWQHHVLHNRHHAEWFTRKGRSISEMTEEDLREMVADFWGAGRAQGKHDLAPWWAANQARIAGLIGEPNAVLADGFVRTLLEWEKGR